MSDTTTTTETPDTEPAAPQSEDWARRYVGLQKVVAARDTELNTRQAALDALKAEHEAAITELNTYRQADVDKSEEETALRTYESLKERFSPTPRPIGNNKARDWTDSRPREAGPERSPGFPV